MTNEERDLILNFIQRVGGSQASGFGSVPSTNPAMPPIDRDADAFIAEQFAKFPEARYRITQLAFVQEHALAEASNRINQLQAENQALRQAQQAQPAQPAASPWGQAAQPAPQPSRGFFGSVFGGGQQAAPPPPPPQYQQPQYQQPQYAPPPPQYAPGYQPGMFQQRGSGFLGSALTTAAGVAGGMVAGNALMNLFSGNHNQGFGGGGFGGGGFGGGGFGSPASAPGYFPPQSPSASPWAAEPAPSADPYEVGGLSKDSTGYGNQDSGGWQQAASNTGGWQDAPDDAPSGGGWTDAGGSDDEV